MKRLLISLLLFPLTMMAMGDRSYTMRSHPDNDRKIDLMLTWQILSEDIDDPLSDNDPRLIASYCAIFKDCKNGISNLAPATPTYIKNVSPNGYTFKPIIKSMACEKHLLSTVKLVYTTERDGQKKEQNIQLDFSGKTPLECKDPTDQTRYMRILLSEIKMTEKK